MPTQCNGYDAARPCPVERQFEVVLEEVRRLSDKLDSYLQRDTDAKQEAASELAEHSTKLKDICGNGQPGRMKQAEDSINSLLANRNYLFGWCAAIAAVVAIAFEVVRIRMAH